MKDATLAGRGAGAGESDTRDGGGQGRRGWCGGERGQPPGEEELGRASVSSGSRGGKAGRRCSPPACYRLPLAPPPPCSPPYAGKGREDSWMLLSGRRDGERVREPGAPRSQDRRRRPPPCPCLPASAAMVPGFGSGRGSRREPRCDVSVMATIWRFFSFPREQRTGMSL